MCVCGARRAYGEVQLHKSSCRKVVAFFSYDKENIKNYKNRNPIEGRTAVYTRTHTHMGMRILSAFLLLFSSVSPLIGVPFLLALETRYFLFIFFLIPFCACPNQDYGSDAGCRETF